MAKIKSLVTGGGGFLGKHLVRKLLDRGDEVMVIGRNFYKDIHQLGADSRKVDIRNREELANHFKGIDEVYHTASVADLWGQWETFYQINVLATQNIIDACHEHHIPKLIYTSSPSVTFDGRAQHFINEDAPYPTRWLAHYPHSKMLAERLILQANHVGQLHTVSIRPHLIWGPGDVHLIPRVIQRAKAKQLTRVGDGQNLVDITHVSNAAQAHVLASEQLGPQKSSNGKAYFISQAEPVRLWDFINEILRRVDLPPVTKSIPYSMAYTLGASMEWVYKKLGNFSEPRMTRFLAGQLALDHYYDTSRAQNDFGYHARITTQQGLDSLFT